MANIDRRTRCFLTQTSGNACGYVFGVAVFGNYSLENNCWDTAHNSDELSFDDGVPKRTQKKITNQFYALDKELHEKITALEEEYGERADEVLSTHGLESVMGIICKLGKYK